MRSKKKPLTSAIKSFPQPSLQQNNHPNLIFHRIQKQNKMFKKSSLNFINRQLFFKSKNEKLKEKKQKLRSQIIKQKQLKQMQECTFNPQINPQIESFNLSAYPSFLKRQTDWLSKRQRKLQQISQQAEKKIIKQCSFTPKISKKSYSILFNNANKTLTTKQQSNLGSNAKEGQSQNFQKLTGSYREIHIKKQSIKQLQKSSSFFEFQLMTEKRHQQKKAYIAQKTVQKFCASFDVNEQQFSFSSLNIPCSVDKVCLSQNQDQIENVAIKVENKEKFQSISCLEIKSQVIRHEDEEKAEMFQERSEEICEEEQIQNKENNQGELKRNEAELVNEQYKKQYSRLGYDIRLENEKSSNQQ